MDSALLCREITAITCDSKITGTVSTLIITSPSNSGSESLIISPCESAWSISGLDPHSISSPITSWVKIVAAVVGRM